MAPAERARATGRPGPPERRGPPPKPAARRSPPEPEPEPEYRGAPEERVREKRSFERGVRSRFTQNLSSIGHVSRDSSGKATVNGARNRKNEPMK
ncbi:hypothetical protein SCALM49S_09819 [Streptomyces californicus]